ncbi:bifunctional choline kinase/ethanolamine kinase CKI1 [Sugiyamaella lignohabitans]|uniref:Bifunctional choline kinase/ethanolamine kinase CKI1 n=1 Tax=Sugiyamaella lignohabitans TaxID=796027 RepID=A0A167F2H6_9ASCO|nr:bifunctional choline kinase/ethanolamine kinase CKI1 [Sugiyamaella lignohabitans]ANB14739.1 bifunctional choline kinase/ethanolamine kinase CKI1 [Sugiyamaella lignohabitans]
MSPPVLTTTAAATPMTSRPKFRRSHSHQGSNDSLTGVSGLESTNNDDETPHVNFFLDNRLPVEYFKQDIVKLAHGLRISRWKRVELAMANDIIVSRISGALTNAVYSVDPPPYLKDQIKKSYKSDGTNRTYHTKVPQRILLRVYGPQVAHIIDREQELTTVARLSARNIGPRLLGTFQNGRFEQFLHAKPLTKNDIRDPDVSVQIAKRMRELHDNVELLEDERAKGPGVWLSIDKWMVRAGEKLKELEASQPGAAQKLLQCADWTEFLTMVRKYKEWITEKYGKDQIIKELVFAHNDTQYGNILRIEPPKGSPLLMPRNEHRQLVVIDFEYSSGNPRGFDISNHFCEWMSDFHDPERPYHIHHDKYPTLKERMNLIDSYVEHGYDDFDHEDQMEKEAKQLLQETIDWRPAVSAYWCIWGIVQAVIDTDEDLHLREQKDIANGSYKFQTGDSTTDSPSLDMEVEEEEDAVFDYIAYSTEKAQLFWTDMINLGLLPASEYKGTLKPMPLLE